jgi:hypothetical protein
MERGEFATEEEGDEEGEEKEERGERTRGSGSQLMRARMILFSSKGCLLTLFIMTPLEV